MICENCFKYELDRAWCPIFDIPYYELEEKCKGCKDFIFINWKVIPGDRKQKRKLYGRLTNGNK